MPLFDKLKQLVTRQPQPDPAPDPAQVYTPPEYGGGERAPDFNIRDVVQVAGAAQAGAYAVKDERRRPLPAPVYLPDQTMGTVQSVGQDLIFVEFAATFRADDWVKPDGTAIVSGDKVRATRPSKATNRANVTIPQRNHGRVNAVNADGTLDLQVMAYFNKADWWNPTEPGMRRQYNMITVTGMIDCLPCQRRAAASVSYARDTDSSTGRDRRRRIYREMWYMREGTNVAINNAFDHSDAAYRMITLAPDAKVLDLSEAQLTTKQAATLDPDTQALIAAVRTQAASIERLTALVEQLMPHNTAGYDAIRTEDRLIVLDPKAIAKEGTPRRKRWLKASKYTDPLMVLQEVKDVLDAGVLGRGNANRSYPATEALYHLLGGARSGFKPMCTTYNDQPHWYLQGPNGDPADPTADPDAPPDYANGNGRGWTTGSVPSQRAFNVVRRVRRNRRRRTAGDEPARGATHWHWIPVHIEHYSGDLRHPEGPHPSFVPFHYGYIPDTEASDGDSIDVILGDATDADTVYLGVQRDPDSGDFAQFKVLADFDDQALAEAAMHIMWPDHMVGDVIPVPVDDFMSAVLPKLDVTASSVTRSWGQRVAVHDLRKAAGRIDDVKRKYPHLERFVDDLIDADPSGNQKYLAWLARQLNETYNQEAEQLGAAPEPGRVYDVKERISAVQATTEAPMWMRPTVTIDPDQTVTVTRVEGGRVHADAGAAGDVDWLSTTFGDLVRRKQLTTEADPGDPATDERAIDQLKAHVLRLANVIGRFHEQLPRITKKDIQQYKTERELIDAVQDAEDRASQKQQREEAKQGATKVIETDDYTVINITNKPASCVYGKGTKWCITMADRDYYETYTDEHGADVYFVMDHANDTKWALIYYEHGSNGENPEDEVVPENGLRIYNAADQRVSADRFPHSAILTELFGDDWTEESAEPAEVEVYYITYTGDDEPQTFGSSEDELHNYAAESTGLRGNGYEIYRATMSRDDWEQYLESGDAYGIETYGDSLVYRKDPETETLYAVVQYHDDPNQPDNATVGTWFESAHEAEQWTNTNLDSWVGDGYAIWQVALPINVREEESEPYWLHTSGLDVELYAEHPPLEDDSVLISVAADDHYVVATLDLGAGGWVPQAMYATLDEARLAAGKLGDAVYYRDADGDVTETTALSPRSPELSPQQALPGFAPSTGPLRAGEQVATPAGPGVVSDTDGYQVTVAYPDGTTKTHDADDVTRSGLGEPPTETKAGPAVGDYMVTVGGMVTVFGTADGVVGPGGVELAKQHRTEQGRPNVPVWQQTPDNQFEVVARRRCRMIEVAARPARTNPT